MLSVLTFRTPAEAVAKADDTPYGLSAGFWTEKGSLILWMASRLRAGVVWANTFNKSIRRPRSGATRSPATAAKAAGTGWRRISMSDTAAPARFPYGRHTSFTSAERFRGRRAGGPTWCRPQGWLPGQRGPGVTQGCPGRGRRRAEGVRRLVRGHRIYRGQVLYRVAELLEGRRAQFAAEVRAAEGLSARQAEAVVDATIDRWVWYAGWADKLAQVQGAANPVAGPYFNFSLPEPTGVVAVIAPQASSLLGFVSVVAPVVVSGNTVVALASENFPLPAVSLTEVLATSDVPGGVINVLTGRTAEIAPWLPRTWTSTPSTCAARRARPPMIWRWPRREPQAGRPGWRSAGCCRPASGGCVPTWKPRPSGTRPLPKVARSEPGPPSARRPRIRPERRAVAAALTAGR